MKTLILLALLSFPDDSQKKHMAISAALSTSIFVPCAVLTERKLSCAFGAVALTNLLGLIKESGVVSQDVYIDRGDLLANGLGSLVIVPLYFAF